MKKLLFFSVLLVIVNTHAQTTINKVLNDFTTLKVYNGIDLELVKSDKQSIEITGSKAEKVKIKEETDGTLKISLRFPETMAEGEVKATLFFNKDILVIDANEGATITGKEIDQPKIDIKAQEGAFINLVINTKHLYVKASSGGVIKLSGTSKNQDINVDLGSTYHGYNMEVSDVSMVKAGSGAKAEILAGETVDAKVSFGGTIFYKGNPEVFKEKTVIGGTIEQRN
ncbi:head GIN domain-containing protein [Tenacibaculum sp. IB213877]|uniref:head GIN domain-containing protein n=1 Tax=Tenacibaculum sp. IB213877 TaxID=3097351 RepID=UPI002A599854|nr:head GIN domain-containing protein [Tenacibaculum sp. IB213877]MDY0780473.1 head GIN domain-containing protein [Tenacibaculum sp. IB213877]